MNFLSISVILLTILQCVFANDAHWFLLAIIVAVISRAVFLLRNIGIVVKGKGCYIAEGFSFFVVLISSLLSDDKRWIPLLLFFVFSLLVVLAVILDNLLYLYIVEDYKED